MKKLVYILALPLVFASCESETTITTGEGNEQTNAPIASGDLIKDKIFGLFADVEKGMKPLSPIAEISKYDSDTKAYIVGEKETGNFSSEWEKDDFEGSRFYSKKYNDDSQLGEVRLSVMVKQDVIYNNETDAEDTSKKIDLDKYIKIISEKTGVEAQEYNGGKLWKTPTANWHLSSYDDYSLSFKMKEAK